MHKKMNWVLTVVLVVSLMVVYALPTSASITRKTIEVVTGVNIVVDDVEMIPRDAKGNPVEVFIYNGTTYLPARAVSESLGKPISWEGSSQTVYIGKRSNAVYPTVMLKDMDYFMNEGEFKYKDSAKDNLGQEYTNAIYASKGKYTYRLDARYSSFKGRVALNYNDRSIEQFEHQQLRIYTDGNLVYSSPQMYAGVEPVDFNIDLTGVLTLEVEIIRNSVYDGAFSLLLIDAGLYQ